MKGLISVIGFLLLAISELVLANMDWVLQGELSQGGYIIGQVDPANKVVFQEKSLSLTQDGAFVIGFGRDAKLDQVVFIDQVAHSFVLKKRQYKEQRVEGIEKKYIEPKPSVLKRIRSETKMVKQARAKSLPLTAFQQTFIKPIEGDRPITGVYGSVRFYNGKPGRPHYGVDFAAPVGTPVIAPADGEVTLAHDDMYYSGGTLIVDHGYGLSSTFIHLSEVLVSPGQKIKQGQVIAKVGAGGRSTGPHLDWRMNWYKTRVDALYFVD